MKTFQWHILFLVVLIVHLQLVLSYPSSNFHAQRTFLRCHFSAIACKRGLPTSIEDEFSSSHINKNNLQACLNENKPIRYCLTHLPMYLPENSNEIE